MNTYYLLYPVAYLALRNDRGSLVIWRDAVPVVILTLTIVGFYQVFPEANFFGKDGFIEKAGSITSSLTGFYIAGLLAVATFTASKAALDEPIAVGPVYFGHGVNRSDSLSRRDYVCLIFGYLSLISLVFSLTAILVTTSASPLNKAISKLTLETEHYRFLVADTVSVVTKSVLVIVIAHLAVTTGYGLYYLTKKIYEREPEIKKKPPQREPRVRRP